MEQEGMKPALAKYNVQVFTGAACKEITDEGVVVSTADGDRLIEGDSVVYALGMRANRDVFYELEECAEDVVMVGDCVKARKVLGAIHESYYAVLDLA